MVKNSPNTAEWLPKGEKELGMTVVKGGKIHSNRTRTVARTDDHSTLGTNECDS